MKYTAVFFCLFNFLYVVGQDWKQNFTEAINASSSENRPIILVFSGSDWCGPCISLDKRIWQSEDFKAYAEQHYILYKADFPRKKENALAKSKAEENKLLAQTFNPKGHFPLVVVLDKNQKVLGVTGFQKGTPKEYIALLNGFVK